MTSKTPKEIVEELDRYIVGHSKAKKSVAVALRNRWRRMQLDEALRDEILPKNILMVGSTGIGKTEMARRLAKLAHAPFIKVEATKFTEIGYVGRDVEQIIRDLVEISIHQTRKTMRAQYETHTKEIAIQKVVRILQTHYSYRDPEKIIRTKILNGSLDSVEIEIATGDGHFSSMDFASSGMIQFGDWLNKTFSDKVSANKLKIPKAIEYFMEQEADKMVDQETLIKNAIANLEQNGIVFIDEIDKICGVGTKQTTDVSREGVQRDLLPLIEGTTVMTKYGNIKTDHILFIGSGAFYIAKPSDLLPELQGRFPIRVEMSQLTEEDFIKILKSTENNLKKQAEALLATEGIKLEFRDDAIEEIAKLAVEINRTFENIGARRLHTLMEKVLEDISFNAPSITDKHQVIDVTYVQAKISELLKKGDLSKFIL